VREALNELYKEKEQILEKYKQIKEQTTLLEEQLPKKKKENLAEKLNISENILLNKKKGGLQLNYLKTKGLMMDVKERFGT
jgi:hypothetical protein